MRVFAAAFLLFVAACHGAAAHGPDAGASDGDASASDIGDAAFFDSGVLPTDAGPGMDGGPVDTGIIMEGTVEIHQLITYVVVEGTMTSTSPPIVFVHMGPGLAHEYLPPLYDYLASSRLLVYYDQRGEGLTSIGPVGSATTSDYTTEQRARDLYDLTGWVQTIVPNATKFDVIAHGYGTAVASMFAADHPDRVAHLVFTAPYPADTRQIADFDAEALSRLTEGEKTMYYVLMDEPQCRGNVSMCSIELWDLMGPHWLCDANRARFSDLSFMNGDFRNKNNIEYYLRQESYDLRPKLAAITAPTTIVAGVCDPTPTTTQLTYTASVSTSQTVVLQESGYFPQIEEPDTYKQIVLHALSR
jgi:pimeloyl-ACP methyl ester carboxylesterase